MWIVQIALRRPYTFVVAALLILLSTPYVLRKMPTDIFPAIDIPVVAMLWQYNGMPAKEIADRLTGSVERSMSLIDGIEHSESLSYAGAAVIKVFFHPDTDIRTAIAQVMSSSNSVYRSLPTNVAPPQVIQYSASDLPLVQLGISSSTVPETEVNDLTNNIVRTELQSKRGVAMTNPFGSKSRQITVDTDVPALLARGLTPTELSDALAAQNLILPTGTIKIDPTDYDVTLNGAIAEIPRLSELPVRTDHGATTLIRDIASVRDGPAPTTTIAHQNGERGILNSVFKIGRVSTLDVVEHVRQAITKMLELLFALTQTDPLRLGVWVPQAYADDIEQKASPLLVPANALVRDKDGTHTVIVDDQGRIDLRSVTIGRDFGREVEILEGVAANDVLVASPSDLLAQGETVSAVEAEDKANEKLVSRS